MTNQFHLDLLRQGTLTWNQWRQEHSDIIPDLSRANLFEVALITSITLFLSAKRHDTIPPL